MSEAVPVIKAWQRQFLDLHRLPDAYLDTADRYFAALAMTLADVVVKTKAKKLATKQPGNQAKHKPSPPGALCVGLNGSQGSGKSTLADYVCCCLAQEHALTAVALSLDDFYLTRAERQSLAADVHPLLQTRGVPGTHDVQLLRQVLEALRTSSAEPVLIPRFDKSIDDRAPENRWTRCETPVDVIILEGWCLGAQSESARIVAQPINALERDEDPHHLWRSYSNRQLKDEYEPLYAQLDYWVMLAAPGFEQVLRWRMEQEQKLRESAAGGGKGVMSDAQLRRFVQHFERYTRQCLRELPQRMDVLLKMDSQRNIIKTHGLALESPGPVRRESNH